MSLRAERYQRQRFAEIAATFILETLLPAAVLVASANLTLAQDIDQGAIAFKKCAICHEIGPGAANGIGPELNGLAGRLSGSVPEFNYSDANKNAHVVWNEETFEEYIQDPQAKIPGTKKIFAGIKNEKEAKNLWAYLKRFDTQGNLNR